MIYTSLVALAQTDMKKLIAYSSVAHMGFVTMGIFAVTSEAVQGAVIQMLSHGLVSAGAVPRASASSTTGCTPATSTAMAGWSTACRPMPLSSCAFMLASVGLPGTSGFVGEFLILLGTFRVSTLECFLAATALFLGALYMLYLYRRVIFGTITRDDLRGMLDLSPREKAVFAPLLVLVLWMGVYPELVPDPDPRLGRPPRAAGPRRRPPQHRIPAQPGPMPRRPSWIRLRRDADERGDAARPLPDLLPALPEIVLACAAMALLLVGVFRGEGSTRLVSWLAVAGADRRPWRSPARLGVDAPRRLLRHVRHRRLRGRS